MDDNTYRYNLICIASPKEAKVSKGEESECRIANIFAKTPTY
jgi:hypothetical protein